MKLEGTALIRKSHLQVAGMVLVSALAQLLGIFRTGIASRTFGTSIGYDYFVLATTIATFAFSFLASGISTALVPAFTQGVSKRIIDGFLSFCLMLSVLLSCACFFFWGVFSDSGDVASPGYLLICFLVVAQFTTAVSVTLVSFLNCRGIYSSPQLIQLGANVLALIAIFADRNLSVSRFALYISIGAALGALGHCLLAVRSGFRFTFAFNIFNRDIIGLVTRVAPTVCGASVYQFTVSVDVALATSIGAGYASRLSYSSTLSTALTSIVLGNLLTFVYPRLSLVVGRSIDEARTYWRRLAILLNYIGLFCVSAYIVAGETVIRIILGEAALNSADIDTIYWATLALIVALPVSAIRDLAYRFYFALGKMIPPFINSVTASAVNVVISLLLAHLVGFYGIVIGTGITMILSAVSMGTRCYLHGFVSVPQVLRLGRELLYAVGIGVVAVIVGTILTAAIKTEGIIGSVIGLGAVSLVFLIAFIPVGRQLKFL